MSAILPGSTIGILGGGQLGRMTAMAARSMGYRLQVMDPDPSCPARFVVDACFEGGWDDTRAAANLARGCDVITLEIEQVSLAVIETASKYAPVRPAGKVLEIIQNRICQKDWLRDNGFPVGPYCAVRSAKDLVMATRELGEVVYLKCAQGGYDGRGQRRLDLYSDLPDEANLEAGLDKVWTELGSRPSIVEKGLSLDCEISVMVARSPSGEIRAFPAARNHHEDQILTWSVIPSSIPQGIQDSAQRIAVGLAAKLGLEGLLAVEMFLTKAGDLLVNELAPRPHNSYHASERCCVTSQFEQHVRAVCDLPLGDVSIVRPGAIANLLGDLWLDREPHFEKALAVPEVRLHLYEKHTPRKGRKMGHLSSTADTPEEAVARVLEAKSKL